MTLEQDRLVRLARELVRLHHTPDHEDPDAHNTQFDRLALELANAVITASQPRSMRVPERS